MQSNRLEFRVYCCFVKEEVSVVHLLTPVEIFEKEYIQVRCIECKLFIEN